MSLCVSVVLVTADYHYMQDTVLCSTQSGPLTIHKCHRHSVWCHEKSLAPRPYYMHVQIC
jgi:hypothetical protein